MPELSILPNSGLSIPATQILNPASYFDKTPLPAPVIDTSKLSAAQGKAALFGSIADTLAKLPDTLMSAYQAGKKMATGSKTTNAYNAALAGNPVAGTSLADFKATSDGAVTFSQEKPEDAELRRLKIEALKRTGQAKKSFYEQEVESLGGTPSGGTTGGLAPLPSDSASEPVLTVDPNADPDSVDYLDGYGKVTAPADPLNPTDAERSAGLLPPAGFKPAAKPSFRGVEKVPLSQLSSFPASAVAPEDAAAIGGAAMNIGNQLTGMQPESALGVSTEGTPAAAIAPVSREQALATFQESPPNREGFSQEQTGSKTLDRSTGIITMKDDSGREFILVPGASHYQEVKPRGGAPTVPAMIRSEAIRMGVYKDGMTAEEVSKAMEDKQIKDGIIPPHLLPQASSLARLVIQHPALKHYPTIREAKEAVDAGLANPGAGGNADMAIVEGFQRMVNPGATVRAQTIDSMTKAAGFMQQLDPSFLWDKAVQGDKFNAAARLRIKKLADDIYERATKNAAPQLKALGQVAKTYGISNPEQFVNNVLVMSPLLDTTGAQATPSAGASPALPAAVATPRDEQAATWAKANPTDPRAAAIKAAQQAKGIWVD